MGIKQLSDYLSIPVKTLYEWASRGEIPSIKLGSRVLFDVQDIDNMMIAKKRSTQQGDKTVNKILGDIR